MIKSLRNGLLYETISFGLFICSPLRGFCAFFFDPFAVLTSRVHPRPSSTVASVGFGFIFLPLTNDWQRGAGAVRLSELPRRKSAKTHQLKVLMAIIMIC